MRITRIAEVVGAVDAAAAAEVLQASGAPSVMLTLGSDAHRAQQRQEGGRGTGNHRYPYPSSLFKKSQPPARVSFLFLFFGCPESLSAFLNL